MQYKKFKEILDNAIFSEGKRSLIEKIAKYPHRYVGVFRATRPSGKLLQNLSQSHEIGFGNAFEEIIEEYFKEWDAKVLNKKLTKDLAVDHCFQYDEKIYFIEQKIRDDHDSTKKRGQFENFKKKAEYMVEEYSSDKIIGIFYFIDPSFLKNIAYYRLQIPKVNDILKSKDKDLDIDLHLFYGEELFEFLKKKEAWATIIDYLDNWKKTIPEISQINFDETPEESFDEIKSLSPLIYKKLFGNKDICTEIIPIIFPKNETLKLLFDHLKAKVSNARNHREALNLLEKYLENK